MTLRRVPKPIRDDTPDPCEIVLKGHFGSDGALMAVVNILREIGMVKQGRFERCQDGTAKQTLTLSVYERASSYATRPEAPYVDKSADIYVMLSENEPDKVKVGLSIHVRVREQQVSRKFEESFKVIHVVHALDAKARETWIHNYLREHGAVDLGSEQFRIKDWHLDWLRSLPNE